jgi:hypothetical protein
MRIGPCAGLIVDKEGRYVRSIMLALESEGPTRAWVLATRCYDVVHLSSHHQLSQPRGPYANLQSERPEPLLGAPGWEHNLRPLRL